LILDTINTNKNTQKSSFGIAKSLYFNTNSTNWYDYGARFYDPQSGRFTTQDAYAEKYLDFSPYQYAANNPILYIDVNGDSINVAQKYLFINKYSNDFITIIRILYTLLGRIR
jgi:RHS repeat-associated protein